MNPCRFYKCLADDIRLKSLMLISQAGEACVCDLMAALELDQPKVSRHLAELRKCGILQDERRGKWVFYHIHPTLPNWAKEVILDTAKHNKDYYQAALTRLKSCQSSTNNCC
ncbi:ArsR family transcriptional regulator [Marinomonas rhizomae]|uniref:ArsR family transcriptional regulator n=1 Tax=Marinomonas rhizomae TaxID=491948 RepID=A0A366J127_9GAMM|nr:metalloregulator ArsR/SmtB family transcription factor [Marinomonas rhizomae]RBP79638.1 ArsR family transcriptional regulator [Marinomonas rhizomae]RNF71633.1 ArsR family transcriptional regulator [Marinomonas rhizomae]